MDTKKIFALNVIELRARKGISQSQLASMVGISKTSANLYESATRVPDIQVLARYAKVLGVTSDYLLGLSENQTLETAALEHELGLWDSAIDKLKCYKKLIEYYLETRPTEDHVRHFTENTNDSETAPEEIKEALGRVGLTSKTIREKIDYLRTFGKVLNYVVNDHELIHFLDEYWIKPEQYSDQECVEITRADRSLIAFIKLQAHIIEKRDFFGEMYAQSREDIKRLEKAENIDYNVQEDNNAKKD